MFDVDIELFSLSWESVTGLSFIYKIAPVNERALTIKQLAVKGADIFCWKKTAVWTINLVLYLV